MASYAYHTLNGHNILIGFTIKEPSVNEMGVVTAWPPVLVAQATKRHPSPTYHHRAGPILDGAHIGDIMTIDGETITFRRPGTEHHVRDVAAERLEEVKAWLRDTVLSYEYISYAMTTHQTFSDDEDIHLFYKDTYIWEAYMRGILNAAVVEYNRTNDAIWGVLDEMMGVGYKEIRRKRLNSANLAEARRMINGEKVMKLNANRNGFEAITEHSPTISANHRETRKVVAQLIEDAARGA